MRLTGVELAALASLHDLCAVSYCNGPVKAMPKCVTHEGARRNLVATDASMDVADQLLALGDGDAPLQNTQGTALVQLVIIRMKDLARLAMRRA